MSSPLQIMHNAVQWLYDQSLNLRSLLIPSSRKIPIHNQVLLGSTIGIAGIIAADFAYGYKQFKYSNNLVQRRIPNPHKHISITHASNTKGNPISSKSPFSLKQSSTMMVQCAASESEYKSFQTPMFLRQNLSFNDWLFQYFYQTRLNLYTNVARRCIDYYFVNYHKKYSPDLRVMGKVLIDLPSFHTMIDPPNLNRHKYTLRKLGVQDRNNVIFFSDNNIRLPFGNGTQLIEFIEVCCEITDDNECIALHWRLKGDKFGYIEMGDPGLNIEEFMVILVLWAALKVHVLCHGYGAKIILKTPNQRNMVENGYAEMSKIYDDFRASQVSMVALNHVARTTVSSVSDHLDSDELQGILDHNSSNMVWKHGSVLQKDLLANMRTMNFLNLARKKLMRLFTINGLHKYYDFEAAFLCICVHSIDHYAGETVQYLSAKLPQAFGIPNIEKFITIFAGQNQPMIRESRLKFLAKSKMLKEFSNYLDSIDAELSDNVYLVNSG